MKTTWWLPTYCPYFDHTHWAKSSKKTVWWFCPLGSLSLFLSFVQNVNYNKNVFQDGVTSSNILSKVSSLTLHTESDGQLAIVDAKKPIKISLENHPDEFLTHNLSLRLPGRIKYKNIPVNSSSCNLILHFAQSDNVTNVTFLVQYGEAPRLDEYDAKIVITKGDAGKIDANSPNLKVLDGRSLIMSNFKEYRYGSSKNEEIIIGYWYEGPMPDIHKFGNPWTHDTLDLPQLYNYTMISLCAGCSYWHEVKEIWTQDGCSVSHVFFS